MKATDKMPRKKKGGQSPARVPSAQFEGGTNTGYLLPPMAANFIPGSSLSRAAKTDIVKNMQEMFSHLDPEVIYIVLSECDFKVENAMDSLLELSVTAADSEPISTTGFERTAAPLLSPHHFTKPSSQMDTSTQSQSSSTSSANLMTEDLDFLLDQEVLTLTEQGNVEGQNNSTSLTLADSAQSNMELHETETSTEQSPSLRSFCGASSPLDQLSNFEDIQKQLSFIDDHATETAVDIPSMDVFTSSQPSAFQQYSKQSHLNPGDTDLKLSILNENMVSSVPVTWNIKAPEFHPQIQVKTDPVFITPVVSNWPREPRPSSHWSRPISQAQQRPCPAVPMSWGQPPPQPLGQNKLSLEGKVLVLLRGPPGSGKSTLASALLERNPGGVILSTDDYFIVNGQYRFDPNVLGEAHSWNHNRAKQACERGASPVIIDNTNMQGWEMKPYVVQGLKYHYKILFREPDTWWKNKPRELERRTKHGVPCERIRRMLCGYERFVTVKSILGSQTPDFKQVAAETSENLSVNSLKPKVPCPDIVGELSGSKSQPHTEAAPFPSDASTTQDSDHYTDEVKNTDIDMGDLDSELDKISESDENIFSHIADTTINKGHCFEAIPVAFSESIGQRMKRERGVKKSGFEDANKSKSESKCEPKDISLQRETLAEEGVEVKRFEFEGDWPPAASLDQRQERRRERQKDNNSCSEKAMDDILRGTTQYNKTIEDPDKEEQKVFDQVIQAGAGSIGTPECSSFPSISFNLEDELNTSSDQPQGCQSEYKEQIVKEVIVEEISDCNSDFNSQDAGLTLDGENDMDQCLNDNTKSCDEICESPECESFEGTKSSQLDDVSGSLEHKLDNTRRSGKQCKLAMTFTQNCLDATVDSFQNCDAAQTNDEPSLELKTDIDPCAEAIMKEADEALVSSFSQTESQDFAVLWRINEDNINISDCSSSEFTILTCDPLRFVPCVNVAVNQTKSKEIPYSVVHDKSTQVAEEELSPIQDITENLNILKRHFKQVTLDTLKDLFEKCQQDLEWTTNLLLDSGERFFRDDESEEEEDRSYTEGGDEQAVGDWPSVNMLDILQFEQLGASGPDVLVEEFQYSNITDSEPCANIGTNNVDATAALSVADGTALPQDKNDKCFNSTLQPVKEGGTNLTPDNTQVGGEKCEADVQGAERAEGVDVQTEDDIRSINEVHRLLQVELEELEREEKYREEQKERHKNTKQKKKQAFDIKSVELKLPTELALQLTELFGPVEVDPDTSSPEDYVLQMDLNLAKLLHQKWKESVQERQKQAALSFRLLQERSSPGRFRMSSGGTSRLNNHPDVGGLPFMDHWNVSQRHVSLRDIIKEELVLQENRDKVRQSRADLDKRDGATLLKEDQLFALFPTIDRHFLLDIFRDHNYSLTQTQLFLHSLLDEGPVKTVFAPEPPRIGHPRAASKDREKKSLDPGMTSYQDTEDPEYQDFRAEANLQRRRQLESFAKAAEAYKQGHKQVASFYAQQGHLHGQRMREANHRAAVQIFQRVNSSLLPRNILDLHGLHVNEALEHLGDVLETKTTECERGLCRPQLSVITGRGNHSQGGVARIRPAVLDYLTNKHYRFTEPKPGLVLVSLK